MLPHYGLISSHLPDDSAPWNRVLHAAAEDAMRVRRYIVQQRMLRTVATGTPPRRIALAC